MYVNVGDEGVCVYVIESVCVFCDSCEFVGYSFCGDGGVVVMEVVVVVLLVVAAAAVAALVVLSTTTRRRRRRRRCVF